MATKFIIQSIVEFIAVIAVIYMASNEDALIDFEDKMINKIRNIKKYNI